MRFRLPFVFLFVILGPITAAEPKSKIVLDIWDAAYLDGNKAGYFHTTVREIDSDGKKIFRTVTEMNLTLRRFNDTVNVRMETGNDETPAGKVTGEFMRQFHGNAKQLVMTGTVQGDKLHVKIDADKPTESTVYWNPNVVGTYRQYRLFQERKVEPGDQFSFRSYEPTITAVVNIQVSVKDKEDVDVLRVREDGDTVTLSRIKQRLLRAEAVPDKVVVPGASVQLPRVAYWLDANLLPVRSETEMPDLGKLVLYRTTREVAMQPAAPGNPRADIGLKSLVPVTRFINNPHDTRSIVYRVTLKGDDDPASAFVQDTRQTIKNINGNSFELHVRNTREPEPRDNPGKPKKEFLASSYYVSSDDARVQELARRAVGNETDPWRKARAIERWVHSRMTPDNTVPFSPADQIARSLKGDCRQYAMLTAAMCRAAGVPSRTALGLIYVPRDRNPVMGFHMWTEVWVDGQWLPIDSTLGMGHIGAAHIKVSDHSWYETTSLTPVLPLSRVLGKVKIEILSVNAEE